MSSANSARPNKKTGVKKQPRPNSQAASGTTEVLPHNNRKKGPVAPKQMTHSTPKQTFRHQPGNEPPNVIPTLSTQSMLSINKNINTW